MRILCIDPDISSREILSRRLAEATRQTELRGVEVLAGDLNIVDADVREGVRSIAFFGPGCYRTLRKHIEQFRSMSPHMPLAIVLGNEVYADVAVDVRKEYNLRTMPLADIAQMAQFVMDCEQHLQPTGEEQTAGVISIVQLKGGVGASTLACALSACWARHDLSVALVDLDDVNPQLTDWARVSPAKRQTMQELMLQGDVPKHRINELVSPVEGFNGKLVAVGQPEHYSEGFHFKADVLEDAPSIGVLISSLVATLRQEFDLVVIDCGRSWGISTFASLPLSQHVVLVTDDDGLSLRRTLDNLRRIYRDSDDAAEFDFRKWSVVLNAYTGRLLSPGDVNDEIEQMELFPESTDLFAVPFSNEGRLWGAPGETFYDLADAGTRKVLTDLAFALIPFRRLDISKSTPVDKIKEQLQRLTGIAL